MGHEIKINRDSISNGHNIVHNGIIPDERPIKYIPNQNIVSPK
tara:strand:+ start:869 stop:997 length:129 start_codon:yes stop_codon:yes gene_type:complete